MRYFFLHSFVKIKSVFILILTVFFLVFLFAHHNMQIASAECNPVGGNPVDCLTVAGTEANLTSKDIQQIAVDILNAALSLLFLVVLGFLIYGGYYWMVSGGNEEKVRKAKQIISSSIIGLIVVLLSLAIITFVSTAIGVAPPETQEGTGLFTGTLSDALTNMISTALTLAGVIALAMIIYGGFRWMTAAGNEDAVSDAKRILTASIIGLIVIIISWAVVNFVIAAVAGG